MGIPQIFQFINASGMQKSSAAVLHVGADTFQHNSMRKREAQMKLTVRAAAIAFLAAGVVVSYAQTSGSTPPAKKHAAAKPAAPAGPTVQEQIDQMKQQFQGEIDGLKADLATKDEQLKQAQQTAADAQAAAAKAEADATAQQQSATDNAAAVSTLQSTVSDLKANAVSLATTVSDETTAIKKQIKNPDAIYFKGVALSFTGSFIAAETADRTAATASDINTAFTGIPLQNSDAYNVSEFFGTGRQSRLAFKASGKLPSVALTGYYEMDWLGTGVTSNNNQSNSYVLRQRQLWADAKTTSGWDFSGGQGWSLVAETTQGLTRGTEILPATIDAQYEAGFVWSRQYSFRVSKDFGKVAYFGFSVENAETLNPGGNNLPSNVLLGSAGTGGGLFNSGGTAAAGTLANYSFNYTPDFIVKMAFEPGWGHWEVFGIERNFRDRIYPCLTATSTSSGCEVASASTTPYNATATGAGLGGGFRAPLGTKAITVGLKGLWGQGVGRYGSSTITDVTLRPNGMISPIHGFSALSTIELNPTKNFMMYFNYGGDYEARDWVLNGTSQVGYGNYSADMSGCGIEPASTASNPTTDPITPGNSTNGCKGNNKDVQEFTAGYWWNIIAGAKGRLRQGIQYSLIRRDLWSGAAGTGTVTNPGGGAHGDDNMIFTSFRYYLP
jgi:Skp family chaperone for outer membrane proteins